MLAHESFEYDSFVPSRGYTRASCKMAAQFPYKTLTLKEVSGRRSAELLKHLRPIQGPSMHIGRNCTGTRYHKQRASS